MLSCCLLLVHNLAFCITVTSVTSVRIIVWLCQVLKGMQQDSRCLKEFTVCRTARCNRWLQHPVEGLRERKMRVAIIET